MAIKLGWGGSVTTDLNFSEFVGADHTVAFRLMPQYPHGYFGAALASAGGPIYFVGQGMFDGTTRKPAFVTQLDNQRRDYPCELKPNVWHTVAVVRKGNTIRTYLQGSELTTPEGPLGLPAAAPSGKVVLGRSDIWQFFGLIDELVVFTRALDLPEIKSLMTIKNQDLVGVWSFPSVPSTVGALKFRRPIVLNGAAELVDTVGGVADAKLLGPPSLQRPMHLPTPTGEEWNVAQGFDERQGASHFAIAVFCLDMNRVDGKTRGTPVYAVAGGTVVKILQSSPSGHLGKDALGHDISGNYIRVQHAAGEVSLYAHILQFSATVAEGEVISVGQKIASAGDTGASENGPGNDHVHLDLSFLQGDLHGEPTGVGIPYAFRDYEVSTDQGQTWRYVPWGTPKAGERVRSLPKWTGWFGLGGPIKEAPAVVMPTTAIEDIYARGMDDRLLQKWWTGTRWMPSDADWARHDDGDFRVGSAPAVVTGPGDIRDVYVRGQDGKLYHKFWNGQTWSAWQPLGRPDGFVTIIGPPSVVKPTAETIDIYVRGSDDRLYQKWWTGTQWMPPELGWAPHDDGDFRLGSSPAVMTGGVDFRDVFVRGRNGVPHHKFWDGKTWSAWLSLGGEIKGAPAVVCSPAGTADIYVRGMDDRVYQKWWTGTEWVPNVGWLPHDETPGFALGSSPSVVAGPGNSRSVYVRGQDGRVYHKMFR
jgi:murein DD-endopeptidase MepM/ murein hydrolase activator NlpD